MLHLPLAACLLAAAVNPSEPAAPPAGFAEAAEAALARYPSAGLGVVRIEDGAIAWHGYAGEQGPGVAARATTLFNTASIAKTVTAELTLRLTADGSIELDEPISSEYVHPHLEDDERHNLLTPALILSHQTGLKNWEHNYEDNRLAFTADPGTGYFYSGAAYEMLAEFNAARMGASFPDLVETRVLEPMGMADLYLGADAAPADRLAVPMDSDGEYREMRRWDGPPSAADNLFVTPVAYARFMIAALGPDAPLQTARHELVVRTDAEAPCALPDPADCPRNGHTLGWTVAVFDDAHYVFHGGSDWAENAIALMDVTSGDGWVVFVNGGNGMGVWLDLLTEFDPDNRMIGFVRDLPQVRAALEHMRAGD